MRRPTSTPRRRLICLVLGLSLLTPLSLFTRSAASKDARGHGVTTAPSALPSKTSGTTRAKRRPETREGEVLVRFREDISEKEKDVLAASFALKRSGKLRGMSGVERLSLLAGQSLDALLSALQSSPSVEFAEPDFVITADHAETLPNDPRFPDQWALGKARGVNAAGSWPQTTGSPSTVIAVIDSGVDFTHHELRDNQWTNPKEKTNGGDADSDNYSGDLHGWDWVTNSAESKDESGHGTAVAGIISATGNNGAGITGVMWRASLMGLRVLDKENKGNVADAVEAIDYAVAKGAHIINCSWGLDSDSMALRQALTRAVTSNVTVVCSAGNGGHDLAQSPRYPASYDIPFVISVASTGKTDELTSTSNWGAMHVAVAAPGEDLLTTKVGGGYDSFSGTSAAAAMVSGVAGLIRTLRPRLSAERTQQMILVGVRKVSALEDKVMSNGVADIAGALGAFRLLKHGEGLNDGDYDGGTGSDGARQGTDAEPSGFTAAEKAVTALPSRPRQSDAADLPNLDSAGRLPRRDPQVVSPVPSTRRRCPPHNRRCNDTSEGAPQSSPTPRPTPGPSPTSAWRGNPGSLASVSALSLLAVLSSAMNGGHPLIDLPLLDFYAPDGGYAHSDTTPARVLPVPAHDSGGSEAFVTAAAFAMQGGGASNLALGKTATQSTTLVYNPPGDAWHAVDGNTDGNYSSGSVTHTNGDSLAWWQVDLGAVQPIGNIDLWNRTDCCAERLANFYVFVSDVPFTSADPAQTQVQAGVWTAYSPGQAPVHSTLAINRTGRYVRVQLAGAGILSLAEVQVFGGATNETVWVEDSLPSGATPAGDEAWNWIGSNPAPYSGSLAHQSNVMAGLHQHYFYNASSTLSVGNGEKLFAYVYLDTANLPSEVMLQFNDGSWEHRAYWGADMIAAGTNGTDSRRFTGSLPASGGWVRLEVPASQVGLEGHTLNGMAFTLYGGRATWDRAGKAVTAYNGSPLGIPGNVEVEQFDLGGQGVGYYDTTPGSHGQDYTQPPSFPPPSFRQPTDVDIYKHPDYSGGYLIVVQAGDWMRYTVDVSTTGSYTMVASTYFWGTTGGTFHVEFDGIDKTGTLQMPGGNVWSNVSKSGMQLTAGRHVMRVVCDTNAPGDNYLGDIDNIRFLSAEARPGNGVTGKYYNNDDFTAYVMTRNDPTVNFNWGDGSPTAAMDSDFFSVRWTGTVVPLYSETYTFYTTTDDGVRLWIDGQLVIDKWIDQAPTEWTGQIALIAGRTYSIRVEFYEHWGGATAKLEWASASQARQVVPQTQLYGCWKGVDQFANDFYQAALVRLPLPAELNNWTTRLTQAQGEAQLIAEAQALGVLVFTSTEYANRRRSDQDYVSDLYWAYLQRAPDAGGLAFWAGQITQCGADQQCRAQKKLDVRAAFDQSGEFQEKVRSLCGTSAAVDANSGVGYDFSTARLDPDNRTGTGGADLLSRNFNWSVPLVSLAGRAGLDLGLSLSYNSLVWTKDATGITFDADEGFPGPGFRLGLPVVQPRFFNPKTGKYAYLLIAPSGGRAELRQVGTSNLYESADSGYLQLTEVGGVLTLLATDGTRLTFTLLGGQYRCNQIKDRNGNYISASYYADGRLDKVIDTLGRTITFNYDAFQNIISITQPWKRETAASPTGVDETHTWATFGYTNLTLQPSFSNLAVMGDQPGTVIPVVTQLGLDDGSYYKFSYNQWGQIWKVTRYAADSVVGGVPQDTHALSYTRLNLPGSDLQSATPQTDCPRFTTQGTWIENGVMNQSAELTTSYSSWTPNMASCDITPPDPTPAVSTDNVVYRETYATIGWQKGLTTNTKLLVNGTQRKWTDITWTQDDTNATYQINPRIIDTTVHDSENHHRRTSTSFYTFTLPSGVSCSLPQNVTEYDANTTTPLRTTRVEYNVSTDYTSRRIIGLPSFTYTYEGGVSAANLRSKVGYLYDEPNNLSDTFLGSLPSSATQHDGTNYGTTFPWRGNANRIMTYEVNQLTGALSGSYLESRIGYKVTGSVAYAKDGAGHLTTMSYTDSFFQSVNRSNPSLQTFAYATTVTDPDNFSATSSYNYDMGGMTQTTNPKNAIMKTRYDSAGRTERVTRRDGVNGVDKGYTSMAYPASMNLVQTYMLTDATKPEAYSVKVLDGLGRVRATAAEHLGSTGGYSAQLFDLDAGGQLVRQSKPTETNASGGTWAALGDDDPANGGSGWVYTVQAYDWKGRPTVTTNTADSTSRTISYDGCGCAGGEVTTLTDDVGNRQRITADILGRQSKLEDLNTDASVYRTTTPTYNARDQITQSVQQVGTSGTAQTTTTEYDGYGRVWKSRLPQASASTVFTYNADNSLNVQTDARGATATYSYNNRGLTTGVTYALSSDVWSVSYGYDSVGNRTSMTDGMGPVSYSYDTISRLTGETRTFTETGRSFTTTYQYNLADELTLVTDHFGASVTYTRDRTGRLTDMPGYTTGIKYRAWGALKEQTLTNGKVVSMSYDARMRMTQFNVPGITGWQYQYNGDGSLQFASNLQTLGTRDERLDRKLIYDQVGRLSQGLSGSQARGEATFPATGPYKQNLTNDVWDHLTFRDNLRGSLYNSYSATYVNNKNQNAGWQYDVNGTLTRTQEGSSITQYAYNCASHMISAVMTTSSSTTTILYGYDGDGLRAKKIETGAPTTYYVRSAAIGGQVLDEVDASGGKLRGYVYQEGKIIAKQEGAGMQWDVRDPANNSNFMLNAAGASVSHVELDPLGTTVDPNNPSYSQNPAGFYGGPSLQGTYCRVGNLGISVPCSLAQFLNGINFGGTVTVHGEEMSLTMAQGLADIGRIDPSDIIFGNPWDLNNMLPRLTFREDLKGGWDARGPVPPPSGPTLGPSSRNFFFNWGAFYAGYLWMSDYGSTGGSKEKGSMVRGAFVKIPGRESLGADELKDYTTQRDYLLKLLNDEDSDCAKYLRDKLGINGSRIAQTVSAQRPFSGPNSTLTMARAGLLPYSHEKAKLTVDKYFGSGIPSAAQAHYASLSGGGGVTQNDVYYLGDFFTPQEILHEALHTFLGVKDDVLKSKEANSTALMNGGCNSDGHAYK